MRLLLHDEEVESIFDLLGCNENGLTYALGWVLSNNKELLKAIVERVAGKDYPCMDYEVRLQEFQEKDQGFTDIELSIDDSLFIIMEAKIGWRLPDQRQLAKYIGRFKGYKACAKRLVVISECRREYAIQALKKTGSKIPVQYLSWHEISSLVHKTRKKLGSKQKRICSDFERYFKKVINTQNLISNKVFCVALNDENFEIVMEKNRYGYPLRKGWPHDPPNYIAFRREGKLHSLHHVDGYKIEESPQGPRVKLLLDKPFKPTSEVKNGNIYGNQHLWFDLDTVFTCQSIQEARDLTQKRQKTV